MLNFEIFGNCRKLSYSNNIYASCSSDEIESFSRASDDFRPRSKSVSFREDKYKIVESQSQSRSTADEW